MKKGASREDSLRCKDSKLNRVWQSTHGRGDMSVRTCLFLSSTATLSDPCQAKFVAPTKPALFSDRRSGVLTHLACCAQPGFLFAPPLPPAEPACIAFGVCISCPCLSDPGLRPQSVFPKLLAVRKSERQCVQKVKVDQSFRPGLVKDGESIRFPWPHPAMSHFSLHVSLARLQRAWGVHAGECHTWSYHIAVRFKVIFRTETWHSNLTEASTTSWSSAIS